LAGVLQAGQQVFRSSSCIGGSFVMDRQALLDEIPADVETGQYPV
jgi:hypothetical protein